MAEIHKHDPEAPPNYQRDADLMQDKANLTHDETAKLMELTPEERVIEKKLRLKIDLIIMPLVVLVRAPRRLITGNIHATNTDIFG